MGSHSIYVEAFSDMLLPLVLKQCPCSIQCWVVAPANDYPLKPPAHMKYGRRRDDVFRH